MKRIATLSLTVASIIIMSSPTYAIPWGKLGKAAGEAAEQSARVAGEAAEQSARVAGEAAEQSGRAAGKADDAVKGLSNKADTTTGNRVSGKDDTPNQILKNGAEEAGLDRENAVKGTRQPPEPDENAINANGSVVTLPTGGSPVPDQGSGGVSPLAVGGVLVATGYGIYRVIKSRS